MFTNQKFFFVNFKLLKSESFNAFQVRRCIIVDLK
jgi:hypothetical protein